MSSAAELLQAAQGHMQARSSTYDKPQGERSMARCVAAFNALTGQSLSEQDGWAFMTVLKLTRFYQRPDVPHRDSIEDGIAYLSLFGEAALSHQADVEALANIKQSSEQAVQAMHDAMTEAERRNKAQAMIDAAEGKWAHHDGGACPIHSSAEVEIIRSGGVRSVGVARKFTWRDDNYKPHQSHMRIVSYRLVG